MEVNKVVTPEVPDGISKNELDFLERLPLKISEQLLEGFQHSLEWEAVREHFEKHSAFARILMRDPGNYRILERIYTGRCFPGVIDEYLSNTESARALANRLEAVISYVGSQIEKRIMQTGKVSIVNLGCGSGRDTIEILSRNPHLIDFLSVDCVDANPDALRVSRELARKKGVVQGFRFMEKSLINLHYSHEIDFGLLIGVLCGLEFRECVAVLRKIRKYFKKGGVLIASNVLETMPREDPFMSYLLRKVMGWRLVYKTVGELREIFEKAGYKWQGCFFDVPTKFHAMGIGVCPS